MLEYLKLNFVGTLTITCFVTRGFPRIVKRYRYDGKSIKLSAPISVFLHTLLYLLTNSKSSKTNQDWL